MMWKQVHYIRRNRFPDLLPSIPLEQVFTEDIFVDDLVVVVVGSLGFNSYYKDIEDYKKRRLEHVVGNMDEDILIVDITEC